MGDLSKNLSRHEMACDCGCGFDTVDFELVDVLQDCVDYFEAKFNVVIELHIRGGNRCKKHNDLLRELYKSSNKARGAPTAVNSMHIYARAADIKLFAKYEKKQIPPNLVASYFENCGKNLSVGRYSNRTHVDTRTDGGKRWRVG